jgi:iron uptake system component EfeO
MTPSLPLRFAGPTTSRSGRDPATNGERRVGEVALVGTGGLYLGGPGLLVSAIVRWWEDGDGVGRWVAGGAAVGAMVAVAAVGAATDHPRHQAGTEVEISVGRCGAGWTRPRSGAQVFLLRDTDTRVADVDLVDAAGAVHAEVEGLAPGTTLPMPVRLGQGRYRFRCAMEGTDPVAGPLVRVTGPAATTPGAEPVTANDLIDPVRAYSAAVAAGLTDLMAKTDALDSAVLSGDLAAARAAWLPAHLAYARLGAAYGTFGDFDTAINGRPDGLAGGVNDPDFTGFPRLEYGLWHGQPAATLAPAAGKLSADVHALVADFPDEQTDPLDLGLRAHEIMEDAVRFDLTGHTDLGSGTGLATALADLDGTATVLDALRPVLAPRYPALGTVDTGMARVRALLLSARTPDGAWIPVAQLDHDRRQKINGAVGDLVERLAPVAVLCEPRRT